MVKKLATRSLHRAGLVGTLKSIFRRNRGRALLIQQNHDRKVDIEVVQEILLNKGYNVRLIPPQMCTRKNVLFRLEELSSVSRDDSASFFYYAGHGSEVPGYVNGIMTNDVNSSVFPWQNRLVPYELLTELGKIRGKKAIVIDSCFSGEFVEEARGLYNDGLIKDYVIITSTTRDGKSISSSSFDLPNTHPLKGSCITPLTHWIYECLRGRARNLANLPFLRYECVPSETINQDEQEGIVDSRINLEMQRVGDSDFIL